ARAEVETDTKAAAALGVRSTPSFLLCCPNGQVLRLGRLVDLPDAMDAEGSAERHKGRAAQ
ncbi:MAG TPA: hypothetical protein VFJ58_09755, partial [Armatimonadota bacterium]|nr:hypothetical protein [Armatimonadota bacterium]